MSEESTIDCDCLVIGAGAGGLAAAALLACAGRQVTVLEAHSAPGGCAGWFDRYHKVPGVPPERFRFDVGATTISGVEPGQPLARLFDALGVWPELHRINPGMVVYLDDGTRITRWNESERWIAECERVFGPAGQREFWTRVASIAGSGWKLSRNNPTFPPHSLSDYLRLMRPGNIAYLPLLGALRTTVEQLLMQCGLDSHWQFRSFIDEQLMITAQNHSGRVPLAVGAMGLDYPSSTWYADGGMSGVILLLEEALRERGGEIRYKRRATQLVRANHRWQVTTGRGERYSAGTVIANPTYPNLEVLLSGVGGEKDMHETDVFDSQREIQKWWGAFTLYGALADTFDDGGTLYHQLHLDEDVWEGGGSIFLSLSRRGDLLRAPEGWRTFSVSTHVPEPWRWLQEHIDREEYRKHKEVMAERIMERIASVVPGFATAEKRWLLSGTPYTFKHYTGRIAGSVGGIPHDIARPLWNMPNYRTEYPDLYIVGDTVYPGQGLPGVTLGALNLVRELTGRVLV